MRKRYGLWIAVGMALLAVLPGCKVPAQVKEIGLSKLVPPAPSWGCLVMAGEGLTWVAAEATGKTVLLAPFAADVSTSAEVSADGQRVAYLTADNGLEVIDLTAGKRQQIGEPFEAADARGEMAWSPDGKTLAFVENHDLHLWDGANRKALVTSGDVATLGWSPDGKLIAYGCRDKEEKDGGLWLVGVAEAKPKRLVKPLDDIFAASFPTFSPDGQWIAFCHAWEGGALAFVKIDGTGYRKEIGPGWLPLKWRPDGSAVVYEALEDEITVRGIFECAPTGDPKPVLEANVNSYDLLPTGEMCWVQVSGKADEQARQLTLTIKPVGTGAEKAVPLPAGSYGECRFRPDGKQIAIWFSGAADEQKMLVCEPGPAVALPVEKVRGFFGWSREPAAGAAAPAAGQDKG